MVEAMGESDPTTKMEGNHGQLNSHLRRKNLERNKEKNVLGIRIWGFSLPKKKKNPKIFHGLLLHYSSFD